MEKPRSWVYFIQEGTDGPIKIGFTASNPRARMLALQTGNAKLLRLVAATCGTQQDEQHLHERFASLRMQGEWFRAAPELVGFVNGVSWSERNIDLPDPSSFAPDAGEVLQEHIRFIRGMIDANSALRESERVRYLLGAFCAQDVHPLRKIPHHLSLACKRIAGALEWLESEENDDETYKDGGVEYTDGVADYELEILRAIMRSHDAAVAAEAKAAEATPASPGEGQPN